MDIVSLVWNDKRPVETDRSFGLNCFDLNKSMLMGDHLIGCTMGNLKAGWFLSICYHWVYFILKPQPLKVVRLYESVIGT